MFKASNGRWTAAYPIVSIFSNDGKSTDSTIVVSLIASDVAGPAAVAFFPFPLPFPFPFPSEPDSVAAAAAAAAAFFRRTIAVFL